MHINLLLRMISFLVKKIDVNYWLARGGADDHYGVFAAVLAIKAC